MSLDLANDLRPKMQVAYVSFQAARASSGQTSSPAEVFDAIAPHYCRIGRPQL